MRIAVLSDIHSNRQALEAVLDDADVCKVETYWCLGDVAGYGPELDQCWRQLRQIAQISSDVWIAGNHDWGLVGRLKSDVFVSILDKQTVVVGDFGAHAWEMITKQQRVLARVYPIGDAPIQRFLAERPLLSSPLSGVYLTHGVVHPDPEIAIGTYAREPLFGNESLLEAGRMADYPSSSRWKAMPKVSKYGWAKPKLILAGHTHIACAWQYPGLNHKDPIWEDWSSRLQYQTLHFNNLKDKPVFANPGSVGFSRDYPGMATYIILDWEEDFIDLTLRRIPYNFEIPLAMLEDIGAPELVKDQLRRGRLRNNHSGISSQT